MRRLIPLLIAVTLSACVHLGLPSDSEAGAGAGAGATGSAGASGGSSATGTNCGLDANTGISLCLGISSCPTARVDPDQFPDCGYRISGSTLDLECLCGDSLCPMGAAASCLDAKALLSEQSAQGVCAGIAEGRCEALKQAIRNSSSACDKACRAQCSGAPGCITLCGC